MRTVTETYNIIPRTVPFTVVHLINARGDAQDTVFLYRTGRISYVTSVLSLGDISPRKLGEAIHLTLCQGGTVHTVVKDDDMETLREYTRVGCTLRGKPHAHN